MARLRSAALPLPYMAFPSRLIWCFLGPYKAFLPGSAGSRAPPRRILTRGPALRPGLSSESLLHSRLNVAKRRAAERLSLGEPVG